MLYIIIFISSRVKRIRALFIFFYKKRTLLCRRSSFLASVLLLHAFVFIVKFEVGAFLCIALHKSYLLVLVERHHTAIAFRIFVVIVVLAGFAFKTVRHTAHRLK